MSAVQKPGRSSVAQRNARRRQLARQRRESEALAPPPPVHKKADGAAKQMAPLAVQSTYRNQAQPSHTVCANEIAAQVTVSSTGDFAVQNFGLPAPGMNDTFGKFLVHPFYTAMGKSFSGMYRKYRYKSYDIIFQPSSAATQAGQITLFYVGNPSEACPTNVQSVSAQTLSQTGSIWSQTKISLLKSEHEIHELDPVQQRQARQIKGEIDSTKYRWCDLSEIQAPGNTYAGYWGVAVSAVDLPVDAEGEVRPKNFGNIRISWEIEFFEAHPQNTSINGATYVATGTVDSTTGDFVFNDKFNNKAAELVWPLSRMGNVGEEVLASGGKHAPVITLGSDGLGYMIEVNYSINQSSEQPELVVIDPAGNEYTLTGTLYTDTNDGYTANTVFLVTKNTVAAMAQTLGIELGGKFWDKFKGACRVVLKKVVSAAEAVLQVAPLVMPLLAYHEARWAKFHPRNIPRLLKTQSHKIMKIAPLDPIEQMLKECKASELAKEQMPEAEEPRYPALDRRGPPQEVKRQPDRSSSNQSRYQKF